LRSSPIAMRKILFVDYALFHIDTNQTKGLIE